MVTIVITAIRGKCRDFQGGYDKEPCPPLRRSGREAFPRKFFAPEEIPVCVRRQM